MADGTEVLGDQQMRRINRRGREAVIAMIAITLALVLAAAWKWVTGG